MLEQRWMHGTSRFVRPKQLFNPTHFGAEIIEADTPAKTFIKTHHYLGSYPSARFRVALMEKRPHRAPELVGVAVFSHPCNEQVVGAWCHDAHDQPLKARQGLVLGRFVLLERLAFNAETWFLARAFKAVRQLMPEIQVVLSYSDPVARTDLEGKLIFPGHIGTIYQAFNGQYLGLSRAKHLWLNAQGRCIDERLLSKVRGEERGIDYALKTLAQAGLPPRLRHESGADYLQRALRSGGLRRLKHSGNHVYMWPLCGQLSPQRKLSAAAAYPKQLTPTQVSLC